MLVVREVPEEVVATMAVVAVDLSVALEMPVPPAPYLATRQFLL